jgi:hypothetical protein
MSDRKPYPPDNPFFKGHSRDEDEKVAEKLFYGITVRDQKTGRDCHRYPPENSPHERHGVEALCRLLVFSCQDLEPGILAGLLCSLDLDGSFGRRLVFKPRKRKRPADSATDLQVYFYVQSLERARLKTESAVKYAMDKFHLSRNAVFEARARIRRENPGLEV